ncbi:hypothetical protein BJV78DRAFT_1133415 [Lactifluus subvellereus]|nr:hypothetical protein BJV78DRAFT_1133415 [Lactifluus subvellereus]
MHLAWVQTRLTIRYWRLCPSPCGVPFQSALFNFQSLLLVILLLICTSTYIRAVAPRLIDSNKQGFLGIFFMSARIGERLSPYVALACVAMAVRMLLS